MLYEVTVRCETSDSFDTADCVLVVVNIGDGGLARLACEVSGALAQTLLRVEVRGADGDVADEANTLHDYLDHTTLWLTSGQLTELLAYWFRENVATTDPDDDGDWPLSVSSTWQSAPGCAPRGRATFSHHANSTRRDLLTSELPLPLEWAPKDLWPTGETITRVLCPAPYGDALMFICSAVASLPLR